MTNKNISKLQRIQNWAARVVLRYSKRDNIPSKTLLNHLHWLPVEARIHYKLSSLCFRFFSGSLPQYLKNCLSLYTPTRTLRSSNSRNIFKQKMSRLKRYGERSFNSFAPKTWNSLPEDLRTSESLYIFKKKLKTYLFKEYLE